MAVISAGTLEAVAQLKDKFSGPAGKVEGANKKLRKAITAGMGAGSAALLKFGSDWQAIERTLVEGTGATGVKLDALKQSVKDLAGEIPKVGNQQVATALADLNTHMGLLDDELEAVAAQALKAGVNTELFGGMVNQMGLGAEEAIQLLDDLVRASQDTGVSVDGLTGVFSRQSARFQAAGGDINDLLPLIVNLATKFRGERGLRGAMSELVQEMDKGLRVSIPSLRDQLGDTTGAVDDLAESGVTLKDKLVQVKEKMGAVVGPSGEAAGAIGSVATSAILLVSQIGGAGGLTAGLTTVKTSLLGLGKALLGPGAVVAGLVAMLGAVHALSQKFPGWIQKSKEITEELAELKNATGPNISKVLDEFEGKVEDTGDALDKTKKELDETGNEIFDLETATKEAEEEVSKLASTFDQLVSSTKAAGTKIEEVERSLPEMEDRAREMYEGLGDMLEGYKTKNEGLLQSILNDWRGWSTTGLQIQTDYWTRSEQKHKEANQVAIGNLASLHKTWFAAEGKELDRRNAQVVTKMSQMANNKEVWGNIGGTMIQAMINGQNVADTLSTAFKSEFVNNSIRFFGDAFSNLFGEVVGAKLPGIIGAILAGIDIAKSILNMGPPEIKPRGPTPRPPLAGADPSRIDPTRRIPRNPHLPGHGDPNSGLPEPPWPNGPPTPRPGGGRPGSGRPGEGEGGNTPATPPDVTPKPGVPIPGPGTPVVLTVDGRVLAEVVAEHMKHGLDGVL